MKQIKTVVADISDIDSLVNWKKTKIDYKC